MMLKNDTLKDKIMIEARKLFAIKGYFGTTTREINQNVGISDGSMYYYFPEGKQEILDTIVREGIDYRIGLTKIKTTEVNNFDDFEKHVIQMYHRVCQSFSDSESYQVMMITLKERFILSDEQSEWLSRILGSVKRNLLEEINKIKDQTSVADDDIYNVVELIVALFEKSVYEELLVKDNHKISQETQTETENQIHFFINLINK